MLFVIFCVLLGILVITYVIQVVMTLFTLHEVGTGCERATQYCTRQVKMSLLVPGYIIYTFVHGWCKHIREDITRGYNRIKSFEQSKE